MSKVVVVGGCGRLGFKFSLVACNKGHNVLIIDIDEERINEVEQGNLPFIENHGEIYLEQALKRKLLSLSMELDKIAESEVIVITIGTPVDSNLNPSLEPVAGVIFDLSEYLQKGQLLIFRNTLSPRILNRIKTLLEDKTGFKVGKDIFLAFAPEITSKNKNIHDLANASQPIGTFDENSFKKAEEFFKTITKGKISHLSPEEATLANLMDNMSQYIQNAVANEFYLISETFGANHHKILDSINLQSANPNASGPGMHKEGWFLVDKIQFTDLITTAFKINESMPAYLLQKIESLNLKVKKVAILGMTNKPNSDDARSSLSYKLRKILFYNDYNVGSYDPYLPEFSNSAELQNADVVILMTPHDEFKDLEKIKQLVKNPNCVYLDLHGVWGNVGTSEHQNIRTSKHQNIST